MAASYLIIFDCDGTLVDSEVLVNRYFVDQVNQLGIGLSYEEAWNHFPGTSLRLCMDYVERVYNVQLPDDFVTRYRQGQKSLFANHLKPIKGVKRCLASLSDYALCVASNGPLQIIKDNLSTTDLSPFFKEKLFSAYELGVWKPDPRLFLHAAEIMNHPIDHCCVVEDSAAGIAAGMAAGMKVFAYQSPDLDSHPQLPKEAISFTHMSQLPALISRAVNV